MPSNIYYYLSIFEFVLIFSSIPDSYASEMCLFHSLDICHCPETISSSTIPTGVNNTESIEILSVCSGKPCDSSCSNYSTCQVNGKIDWQ